MASNCTICQGVGTTPVANERKNGVGITPVANERKNISYPNNEDKKYKVKIILVQ